VTDMATGLQYMNARFYEPSTGRFITQDSVSGNPYEPWTQNLYSYCDNNPTNMIDPTGHDSSSAEAIFQWAQEVFESSKCWDESGLYPVGIIEALVSGVAALAALAAEYGPELPGAIDSLQKAVEGTKNAGNQAPNNAGHAGNSTNQDPNKFDKKNKLPKGDQSSQLNHIFNDESGHLADTPDNRAILEKVANDPNDYIGTDKYGNDWHSETIDGKQIWVESRNGQIWDGGENEAPRVWDTETGLKSPNAPHK
jgi:RHS repeat-associated core domain